MKQLHHLVNIIPVIAKADTLTVSELKALKLQIMSEIMENGIRIYSGEIDEDDESAEIGDLRVSATVSVTCCGLPGMVHAWPGAGLGAFLHCWQQHTVGGEWEEGAWETLPLGCGRGGKQGSLRLCKTPQHAHQVSIYTIP